MIIRPLAPAENVSRKVRTMVSLPSTSGGCSIAKRIAKLWEAEHALKGALERALDGVRRVHYAARVKCPRCQAPSDPAARFCRDCGARLEPACPSCGEPVTPGKKFCGSCGAALAGQSARFASLEAYTPRDLAERILSSREALEGERKQVTVLFADLKGSMELLADRDPEEARRLDPVLERMMEAVHRYEGTVNQVMGDGIMALFGAPLAHEDHAVRACYAALRMQESVKRYAEEVRQSQGLQPRSASASTPARWSSAPSAATSTWTTPPWARPPTWRPAWSKRRRPASSWPPRPRRGLRAPTSPSNRSGRLA